MIAYRGGAPILATQFLRDTQRVTRALGSCANVLNACTDRYRFTVGFAATLAAGKVSLLPSTHTPAMMRQLREFAPDVRCLTDDAACSIELPRIPYPAAEAAATGEPTGEGVLSVPLIDAAQLAAVVFTSGSTGAPLPYRKSFGKLMQCVREEALQLGLSGSRPWTIIATVPAQHMYGFESSVLLALGNGHALCAERPFYPADIAAAVNSVPRPRLVITTPVHLRALLAAGVALPPTDGIVSSTAPLPQQLAAEAEQRFGTHLLEIYGSTETGQIATRRPTQSPEWQLWPGVTLSSSGQTSFAHGAHIEQRTPMCDVLELTGDGRFLMHGRVTDLVNIAGKRSSLGYLNHHLNSIPGVEDGAFFHVEPSAASHTGVTRVGACVVAPGLDSARLLEALRQRIDAAFLPRPLLFVARLPRNATGKLPHEALRSLVAAQAK